MDFLRRNKRSVLFIIIFICIIAMLLTANRGEPTFLGNSVGFIVTGVQRGVTSVEDWFGAKFNALANIDKIEDENEELKLQLAEKELQMDRLSQLEEENKGLRELLEMDKRYPDYPKVAAKIIAKDPGNWYETFLIDKGSGDGIKKNMVVIATGGLVGRVTECGFNYAKVMSVINSTDAVSAKSLRSNDVGFIRGDYSKKGRCRMEYIDNDAEIIEGDEIVTSHLSEIYPSGIRIGYVSEIGTGSNDLTKLAMVEPAVDFKHLERVLVIKQNFEKEYIDSEEETEQTT